MQPGDTLWDISAKFLTDPWYWPEIWHINQQVANPHLIYPGDELALTWVDGRPQVTLARGGPVRLSPRVRENPLTDAIHAIPYERIAAFMQRPAVLTKDQVEGAPYVAHARDHRLISSVGNDIYARRLADGAVGNRYSIYHVGDELKDPDDGDLLGYQGQFTGDADLNRAGDPATLRVVDSARETLEGDILLPAAADPKMDFVPRAPGTQVDGRIMSVIDERTVVADYDVVIINRGTKHGLEPGHVLEVWQAGEEVRDVTTESREREGPAAGRAQRARDDLQGLRPHELRADVAVGPRGSRRGRRPLALTGLHHSRSWKRRPRAGVFVTGDREASSSWRRSWPAGVPSLAPELYALARDPGRPDRRQERRAARSPRPERRAQVGGEGVSIQERAGHPAGIPRLRRPRSRQPCGSVINSVGPGQKWMPSPAVTGPNIRGMSAREPRDERIGWLERLRGPGAPDPAGIDRDLEWLAGPDRSLLTVDDPRYPAQLAAVPGMPAALFVRGDPALLSRPQVAIVGSRAATAAGCETAFGFAARLAAHGFAITSGLASGIDAAAHRGALAACGVTVAVCGTGLDRVYPPGHARLADRDRGDGRARQRIPDRHAARRVQLPAPQPADVRALARRARRRGRRAIRLAHHGAPRRRAGPRSHGGPRLHT